MRQLTGPLGPRRKSPRLSLKEQQSLTQVNKACLDCKCYGLLACFPRHALLTLPNYPSRNSFTNGQNFRQLAVLFSMPSSCHGVGTPRTTHSTHSPGDEDTRARAGHRDDSVSSQNTCGKDAMVRNARFATLFRVCES